MRHIIVFLVTVTLCVTSMYAQSTLQTDYVTLTTRKNDLSKQDQSLKDKRKNFDKIGRELRLKWGACGNGRWSVIWTPFEVKLKKALNSIGRDRKKLNELQRELMRKEIQLESTRVSIEEKYKDSRGVRYDSEFRKYMADLEIDFLLRYEDEYLFALAEYLTSVEIWQASTIDAINACRNNQIGAPILTAALINLDRVFETLDSLKALLNK